MGIINEFLSSFKLSPANATKEITPKDLDRVSGRELVRENPDRLLSSLGRDFELYDKIFEDDRVHFAINLKKRLILSVPHRIISASDEKKDIEIAQEVRYQLGCDGSNRYEHEVGYSFVNFMDNALDAMGYGYKVVEKCFKKENGMIILYNLKHRYSQYFDFDYDEYGNLNQLLIGHEYGKDITIEGADKIKEKFMLYVYPYPKDGNFYGDSDFKEIYEQYRAKKQIFRFRNIHLQNWGSPIPVVTYDKRSVSFEEKEEIKEMLDHFQDQLYMLVPGQWNESAKKIIGKFDFDIKEAKSGTATDQYEKAIDQIDKQITRALLIPDKLGFSESPGGTYNLAEIQDGLLAGVIKYMHSWLEKPINSLIKQIVDYNFSGVKEYPRFEFDEINDDLSENMMRLLFENGVIDKREGWIRARFGIPELSEKEKKEIEEQKEKDRPQMLPENDNDNSNGDENGGDNNGDKEDKEDKEEQKENKDNKLKHCFKSSGTPFRYKEVEKEIDKKEFEFISKYIKLHKENSDYLIKQIQKKQIIENKDLKLVDSLKIMKSKVKQFLINEFAGAYFYGKTDGIGEVSNRYKKASLLKANQTKKDKKENEEGFLFSSTQQEAHWHNLIIDQDGNGKTTATLSIAGDEVSHSHEINDFEIKEASNGGHSHEIQGLASLKKYDMAEIDWLDREYIERIIAREGDLGVLSSEDIEALKLIRDRGFSISGVEEERMLKTIRDIIDNGIKSGTQGTIIINQINNALYEDRKKYSLTIARTNISTHYNTGRMNFFTSSPLDKVIEAYQYTAIIDINTTGFCSSHDGQIIKASDPRLSTLTPPNHYNCRSTFIPIMIGEKEEEGGYFYNYDEKLKNWGDGISGSDLNPAKGFGGA